MGYTVSKKTIGLNDKVNSLIGQERRVADMADVIRANIERQQIQHADLMLALGEIRCLLRQAEEELEKAVNS